MQMKKYSYMFEVEPDITDKSSARPADTHYITSTTHMDPPGTYCVLNKGRTKQITIISQLPGVLND